MVNPEVYGWARYDVEHRYVCIGVLPIGQALSLEAPVWMPLQQLCPIDSQLRMAVPAAQHNMRTSDTNLLSNEYDYVHYLDID